MLRFGSADCNGEALSDNANAFAGARTVHHSIGERVDAVQDNKA